MISVHKIPVLISILLLFSSCGKSQTISKLDGYNLQKPAASYILPDSLHEVSGVAVINGSQFACIQDENGIVFIFDTRLKRIVHKYVFNINGDYEGIARLNNSLYILRSDGTIFEIVDFQSASFRVNTYITGILAGDNEGLCLDASNKRLLIASKSSPGKGSEYRDLRTVYGFDLNTKELSEKPVYQFNTGSLLDFATAHQVKLPVRKTKKGKSVPILKLRTSDIDIHPLTRDLYLLSAVDHMLCVFNPDGSIKHIEILDPVLFNKPEGLTFLGNGDMVITNEGEDKKPTLLKYTYVKY